jgi:hypothetical protein
LRELKKINFSFIKSELTLKNFNQVFKLSSSIEEIFFLKICELNTELKVLFQQNEKCSKKY